MEESEDPIAGGKRACINKKQKPPRMGKNKLASWAGHLTLGNEPTRNCKHKEIIKGANDEGNEGKQLGKMNQ